jgi:protein-disulfide isomerase
MARDQRHGNAAPTTRRERRRLEREERASRPRPRPTVRSWWESPMVLATAAALGIAAIAIAVAIATTRPSAPPPTTGFATPPSWQPAGLADGQALGRSDAPAVLEVIGDYQCPVCGRFAREYLPRLVTDFVAAGQLRVVDRPIAFLGTGDPDESLDAAVAATCAARQGRYWDFHDYLMWNQEGENKGAFGRERLVAMAGAAGLDAAAQATCVADPTVADGVRSETNRVLGLGINSTPTFILDGQQIVGLVPYEQLAAAIGAAIQ